MIYGKNYKLTLLFFILSILLNVSETTLEIAVYGLFCFWTIVVLAIETLIDVIWIDYWPNYYMPKYPKLDLKMGGDFSSRFIFF